NMFKRELPQRLDETSVGYSDVGSRLDLLASCSPHCDELRISSDKGDKCIKTTVAFADTQSVDAVQLIHAVIEDESYDVMSQKVFSVYEQVEAWCIQHHIKMIVCCDLKMTAMLL